jgi:translocator protein
MKSWLIICFVAYCIAFSSLILTPKKAKWLLELSRPKWLIFKPAIPVIWIIIISFCAASANIVWQTNPGILTTWLLMCLYLIMGILVAAYVPATHKLQNLRVGAKIGLACVIFGLILLLSILPVSRVAALLLIPFFIWNPIGTEYTEDLIHLDLGNKSRE